MGAESGDADERTLRQLVLGYLEEHPLSMDTLAGIAEWWLERRRIRVEIERIAQILEDLTRQGRIEAIGSGAERRYRLGARPTDAEWRS